MDVVDAQGRMDVRTTVGSLYCTVGRCEVKVGGRECDTASSHAEGAGTGVSTSTPQYSTVHLSTFQNSAVHHSTPHHTAAHHSTPQHTTAQAQAQVLQALQDSLHYEYMARHVIRPMVYTDSVLLVHCTLCGRAWLGTRKLL